LTAKILDGLSAAAFLQSDVKRAVSQIQTEGIRPCLATILVGDDPSSAIYVGNKQKAAETVGILTRDHKLSSKCTQNELLELVKALNQDTEVHGILIQLPLPSHLDEFSVFTVLDPRKDVDCLTPYNSGLLINQKATLKPCTPTGIMALLNFHEIDLESLDITIINRSKLVGKPLVFLLLEKNATVTICHSKTKLLSEKIKNADVVISAVGNRKDFVVRADMVKPGSIIVDVGITRFEGKLVGDVDFENVKEVAAWVTPVPGGVGPMTVSMLLKNTVTASSLCKDLIYP
jgi:methylenetetrahydrofolate dehydrogenase (NADP+)/methenyltetrahydrofolate cyclohydrolase